MVQYEWCGPCGKPTATCPIDRVCSGCGREPRCDLGTSATLALNAVRRYVASLQSEANAIAILETRPDTEAMLALLRDAAVTFPRHADEWAEQ
jgi:hypothetical protein